MYDIENLGAVVFYTSYVDQMIKCLCYEDSFWEKRGRDAYDNYPTKKPRGILSQTADSAWNWVSDNWSPVPIGPVLGSSPQLSPSSSTSSSSGGLRPRSGAY